MRAACVARDAEAAARLSPPAGGPRREGDYRRERDENWKRDPSQ
jgi:hypothetical protein